MKAIITGASGMIGKAVLLECLDHPEVESVLSIGRRNLNLEHQKLKQLLHQDFSSFKSISDQLKDYDTCYACMGVSAAGMKEMDYTKMTYAYTMALAQELHDINPAMTFIYVSGQGTDSTERGSQMWARVKGKTENDVFNLGFRQAFAFRPGAIIPLRGIKPSSKLYRVLITYLTWLIKLIKWLSPNSVIDTTQIGLAMINATLFGYDQKIITPKDIIALAQCTKKHE